MVYLYLFITAIVAGIILHLIKNMCNHKYKVISESIATYDNVPIGRVFYLQCEKCGKIKKQSLT